jgi:SRSO17 transposase
VDRSAEGAGNESRLASYLEHLASSLGHADRRAPFGSYCKGLILPGERKSVEPIAARVEELRGKIGDGVNQAADLISVTVSIPSLNFIPLTTFGNWF